MSKRRIKRLTGHEFVGKDENIGIEFYLKINSFSDLSVLVFDPSSKSIKEFILDTGGLLATYQFSEGQEITPLKTLQHMEKPPYYVKLISKGATILSARESRLYASILLASVSEYGTQRNRALTLRRVAYLPTKEDFLMGVDTLSLSVSISKGIIKKVKKLFNKKGLEVELDQILNRGEDENGTD